VFQPDSALPDRRVKSRHELVALTLLDLWSYSTDTLTTPDRIMRSARAALNDTSMTRPRTNGPRSLTRQRIEWPAYVTVTTLPKVRVR
jgi:hypothetical protein